MRIREIDGLRAIAALAVVAHHYFSWIKYSGSQYCWLGVDLFFVISGFLITSILLDLKTTPSYFRTFYARRAFRIFPPYFFVLGIYLICAAVLHRVGTIGLWLKYAFYYAGLLFSNNTQYGLSLSVFFGLNVLWSLSVEELFYIVWAPAVRFLRHRRFGFLLVGIILVAPVLRLLLHSHSPLEVFTFYCRMDGLAFGAVVAAMVRAIRHESPQLLLWSRALDRMCVITGVLFVAFFVAVGADYTKLRVTVLGITIADLFFASLVYFIVRHSGESHLLLRVLRLKPLGSIGMISYSLYLVHYPLLIVSQNICIRFHLRGKVNAFTIDGVGLALSFATAFAMWYGFEAYSLKLKDKLFPSPLEVQTRRDSLQPCQNR